MQYGGSSAPTGWLLCDGSSVSTTTYADLFAAIGYTYGGSGASFNLPDLRQRFPLGKASSGTGSSLGDTGGSIDHNHSVDPPNTSSTSNGSHSHTVDPPSTNTGSSSSNVGRDGGLFNEDVARSNHTHSLDISQFNSGTESAHSHTTDIGSFNSGNNNPPFVVVNYIIKI